MSLAQRSQVRVGWGQQRCGGRWRADLQAVKCWIVLGAELLSFAHRWEGQLGRSAFVVETLGLIVLASSTKYGVAPRVGPQLGYV